MIKRFLKRNIRITYIVSIVLILALACGWYLSDYYRADQEAMSNYRRTKPIEDIMIADNVRGYIPENPEAGFIFYPGGKVEALAYEPLLLACAEADVLCMLVEMPFNLAVFDVGAAKGLIERYPDIANWYIGGHSLGGSMAASYLAKNTNEYDGLILLGSYSTVDFSKSDLKVLSVYGSEDMVLNREKYQENKKNLPTNFTEIEIPGGCHAYFGVYGKQDGDGEALISNKEQIQITAKEISDFIFD